MEKNVPQKILYILPHSIEPYKLNLEYFSSYDAYSHLYCKIARQQGYIATLSYLSLSVKKRILHKHKYGHLLIAYPVTLNRGYFGYEISIELLSDVIRCDYDIIHVHSYYLLMYDFIALAKKLNNKLLIAHYHGGDPSTLLFPLRFLKRMTLRLADKIITVNKTEKQRLIKYWKLPPEKVVYLPNGADTKLFKPLSGVKKEDNVVLFVGNLIPGKGLELLIPAFVKCRRRIKDLKLWIVGDGYLRPKLEEVVKVLGLSESAKFFGRINHEQLSHIYNRATVTVLPSKKESFGLVLVESMACGTPVVATITEGSVDIISDGIDGLLVPQNDVEALSRAICKVVLNVDLRKKMGENARKKVVEHFSWEKIGERLNTLYRSLYV
jgi:glycosyltransferase involved in cell wall biosynthesis